MIGVDLVYVEAKDGFMRSRTSVIVIGCALAAVTLAGCKSGTTSAAGSGPTQPAAGQSSAVAGQSTAAGQSSAAASGGGGSSTGDGLGHPVNVCSLLPVATIAQLSGETVTTAKEEDLPNAKSYTCVYTDAISTSNVAVTVLAMNAAVSFNAGIAAFGSSAKQISGVGDKAYSDPIGLSALFGNVEISVTGLSGNDDAAVKIIQTLQPTL